jgi:hypothetical protein
MIPHSYTSVMNATAIPNVFIPHAAQVIEGVHWMMFKNNGTFEGFKAMPNGMRYEGREYGKMGYNSDTHTVHYKEMPLATAC